MWIHPFEATARILVEPAVLDMIFGFRQNAAHKTEAGGILLGFRRGDHLHIVEATTPQPADRRSLFRFFRRDRYHQSVALKRWKESNAMVDYLGEWHTHPEVRPTPSFLDMSEWIQICRREPLPMVFIIVGMDSSLWVGVGVNDCVLNAVIAV
ncbi:integrative and conjugative element protein, VC0181 family [Collimonas sp. OK307]|nr:integrative and conjugative element protein, VC0181 family [Collimonas sp. OK307]